MKIIVDLTEVEEAFGSDTTYFGGAVHLTIDGEITSKVVDGWSDRSTTPFDYVYEKVSEVFDIDEDTLVGCFESGNKYEASYEDDKLTISEVKEQRKKLRVWWIRNVPNGDRLELFVDDVNTAKAMLATLSHSDLKLPESAVSSNAGGLEVFEDGEWCEWSDEFGDEIDYDDVFEYMRDGD